MDTEAAYQPDDQRISPALAGALGRLDTTSCQLSVDGCLGEMAGIPQDRRRMSPLIRFLRSPRPNGGTPLPSLDEWEASAIKPPTVRTIANFRIEVQRTEKDSAIIELHPSPIRAKEKGEGRQHDGVGRGAPRDRGIILSDSGQGGQTVTPQDELGTIRRSDTRCLEATSPSPSLVKGRLPHISDKQGTPIFRKALDCLSTTIRPEGIHGDTDEKAKAAQYRARTNQSPHPHLRGTIPSTGRGVERTTRPPSPRVTRSRVVGQQMENTATGLCPAPKRAGTKRRKHHLDEMEGQTPWDACVIPPKDQQKLRVESQYDLRATARKKGKINVAGEQVEGSESRGKRPTCMKYLGEEEKREHLEGGREGAVTSTQKDRREPMDCARVNGITVIDRVGPVTRARSRAQALTQV